MDREAPALFAPALERRGAGARDRRGARGHHERGDREDPSSRHCPPVAPDGGWRCKTFRARRGHNTPAGAPSPRAGRDQRPGPIKASATSRMRGSTRRSRVLSAVRSLRSATRAAGGRWAIRPLPSSSSAARRSRPTSPTAPRTARAYRRPGTRARDAGAQRATNSVCSLPRLRGRGGEGRTSADLSACPLPNPPPFTGEGTHRARGGEHVECAARISIQQNRNENAPTPIGNRHENDPPPISRRAKMRARDARLRDSTRRRAQVAVERRALPTPERLRRAGKDVARGNSGQITMRHAPLERAFARGALTAEQYSAGQKYRHHWYHAGLSGGLISVGLGAYAGMAKTERQVFHRQRYREAVQVLGKISSHVLEWAVCREFGLEQIGQALGWTSRPQAYAAALERMKAALDELCRLWGIGNREG